MNDRFSLCIAALLFLSCISCAPRITETQCRQGDWYEIGRRDGALGKPITAFDRYADACFEYEVKPDRKAYFEGRDAGLEAYCTYQNGLEQGKLGRVYRHVCPADLEPDYLAGYRRGKEIKAITRKLQKLERRQRSIDHQIKEKERKLIASKLSDRERRALRYDLKQLDIEYREIAWKIKELEGQL